MFKKSLNVVNFAYHAILPFLGYIAVLKLEIDVKSVNWLPFLGWIVLLLYQIIKLGILSTQQRSSIKVLYHFVPPLLLLTNHYYFSDDIWHFFLDQAVLEIVALMLALCILFIFFKDHHGVRSWQELGIIPILVIAFIMFGSLAFVDTWLQRNLYFAEGEAPLALLSFSAAFLIAMRNHLDILNRILKRKLTIPDVFANKKSLTVLLIIGQILIWMIAIPLIF